MSRLVDVASEDRALIRIVDAAMAEAVRKSGHWLACRPGCTQCCISPFAITELDARRLRQGLAELEDRDPGRAARVRQRARESVRRLSPGFPGDTRTGILAQDDEAENRLENFAEQEPCPVLDPATGCCDLYEARPMTCRTFGPPVRCGSNAVAVCELCFEGATDAEIEACEVDVDPDGREAELLEELQKIASGSGMTIVAFALGL